MDVQNWCFFLCSTYLIGRIDRSMGFFRSPIICVLYCALLYVLYMYLSLT